MSRILVTGGAGFIGSHVARALVRDGHEVTILDDLSGGFEANVPAGASLVRGSIVDAALVDRLCAEGRFAAIYHLAAYAAEGLSHFIKRFNYTNNVIGSVNLLNAAVNNGVRRFVFTSSIAVYGSRQPLPLTEGCAPDPEDSYGIAKYAIELELRACFELFGLEYVIFRPHNVFGPGQNIGDRYRNVVGIFMNQALLGQPMTVFGDGTQTRAFTYIDDVVPPMVGALERDDCRNAVFNVGADSPCSLNDLASKVAAAMGVDARIVHLPPRREAPHLLAAHDKVRRFFPECPETPLEEGLARMAAWVHAHGARRGARFAHIEIERNLPPSWRRP